MPSELPAVTIYDTAETPHPVLDSRGPEADPTHFGRAFQGATRDAGFFLRGDGRLALLAQRLVYEPAGDARSLAASARSFGLAEVAIEHRIVRSRGRAPLANAVATQLTDVLRTLQATHFGAFIAHDGRSASIVLTRRSFVLTPVARKAAPGATLTLAGRLSAGFRDPKLVVTSPTGAITLPAGGGPDFELRVPARVEGEYRLQLQATADETAVSSARQTLAELVVMVGDARHAAADATPAPMAAGRASDRSSAQVAQLCTRVLRRCARRLGSRS